MLEAKVFLVVPERSASSFVVDFGPLVVRGFKLLAVSIGHSCVDYIRELVHSVVQGFLLSEILEGIFNLSSPCVSNNRKGVYRPIYVT